MNILKNMYSIVIKYALLKKTIILKDIMRVDSSLHHVHCLAGVHEHDEPPPNI